MRGQKQARDGEVARSLRCLSPSQAWLHPRQRGLPDVTASSRSVLALVEAQLGVDASWGEASQPVPQPSTSGGE